MMATVSSAFAVKVAHAVLSSTNEGASYTLTFYFGELYNNDNTITFALNDEDDDPGWYVFSFETAANEYNITKVVFDPSFAAARPVSTRCWFAGLPNLHEIYGLHYLNTSNVKNMAKMFSGCSNLHAIDVTNFNTRNVTNMSFMFHDCHKLHYIDMKSFKTHNVTDFSHMFESCSSLEQIDVRNFVTKKVEDMSYMFAGCSNVKSIDLASFDMTNVYDSANLFNSCSNLSAVTLPSTVTSVSNEAFTLCSKLTTLKVLAVFPPELEDPFVFTNEAPTIIVPASSVNNYRAATGWYANKENIKSDKDIASSDN